MSFRFQSDIPTPLTRELIGINTLRQSLMCSADVTPNVWQVKANVSQIQFNTLHTCRDFEGIQKWASEHRSPGILDKNDSQDAHDLSEFTPSHEDLVNAGLLLDGE